MCTVLKDVLDKVTWILPAIESARPGYRMGIQELCSINKQLEKGKDIIQHCKEDSKLYLVCYLAPEVHKRQCYTFLFCSLKLQISHVFSLQILI
jgi:hypothetical protein